MPASHPPLLGEPLALELANTLFTHRGRELDGLRTPAELARWLQRVRGRLALDPADDELAAIGPAELSAARELRDALRTLFANSTGGAELDQDAAETLNRIVRAAPRWHELSVQPTPVSVVETAASAVCAVLAALAEEAILILSGPQVSALRACAAPGCILFYRKDHPRRTWCSPRCSNRVRSARHYARRAAAS